MTSDSADQLAKEIVDELEPYIAPYYQEFTDQLIKAVAARIKKRSGSIYMEKGWIKPEGGEYVP